MLDLKIEELSNYKVPELKGLCSSVGVSTKVRQRSENCPFSFVAGEALHVVSVMVGAVQTSRLHSRPAPQRHCEAMLHVLRTLS